MTSDHACSTGSDVGSSGIGDVAKKSSPSTSANSSSTGCTASPNARAISRRAMPSRCRCRTVGGGVTEQHRPEPAAVCATVTGMTTERCEECGFDGDEWTDNGALDAVRELPARWRAATFDVEQLQAVRRPIPQTWSIAEYADHVREVLFGMRFLIDTVGHSTGHRPRREVHPVHSRQNPGMSTSHERSTESRPKPLSSPTGSPSSRTVPGTTQ